MVGLMKPIRLIKMSSTQDVNGRWSETQAAAYNVFASLQKTSTGRTVNSGQTGISNTIQFKMYARELFNISAKWRIVYDGKLWTVTGIDKIDEKLFNTLITAVEHGKN